MDKVFIIAEAGVNHNGNLDLAIQMIDAAKKCGVDAIKFQTAIPELVVVQSAPKAEYQKENMNNDDSQLDMIKKIHLPLNDYIKLQEYCKSIGIIFLSSPFDNESVKFLNSIGMKIFKIPSGEITNLPYLRLIGSLKKEVILSTGMATMDEIKDALNILTAAGTPKDKITILHANTMYPTPMEDVNLQAMLSIGKEFGINFGYSDHTLGIEVDIAAVALGAKIIEKHFTLDKTMKGPDHKASLEPDELALMVKSIRNIEQALGDGIKKPSKSEQANIPIVRRSIVAKEDISQGEILSEENMIVKRPASGISPMKWDQIIGTKALKNYNKDDLI